jgi:hypothetical protein
MKERLKQEHDCSTKYQQESAEEWLATAYTIGTIPSRTANPVNVVEDSTINPPHHHRFDYYAPPLRHPTGAWRPQRRAQF